MYVRAVIQSFLLSKLVNRKTSTKAVMYYWLHETIWVDHKTVLNPKGLTHSLNKLYTFHSLYTFAFHGLACATIQCLQQNFLSYAQMLNPSSIVIWMAGIGIDVFQIQGHSFNLCMFEQLFKFNFKFQFLILNSSS